MSTAPTSLRAPLARAKGLGSAHHGTHHWLGQRLSGIALLVLSFWFASGMAVMIGQPFDVWRLWLGFPMVAATMALFLVATLWHAVLGLQVVVEDYVGDKAAKLALLAAIRLVMAAAAGFGLFAILKLAN